MRREKREFSEELRKISYKFTERISRCLYLLTLYLLRKMFFAMSRVWDEENILIPHEEWNLRPSDLRSDALALSHRDSTVSEIY